MASKTQKSFLFLYLLTFAAPAFAQTTTRPVIDSVITASAFGGYNALAAPGSYIEIYGSNLAGTTRGWSTADFNGSIAPTSLDGVTVTVNATPAFVNYVSPRQLNVQIPDTIPAGGAVNVVVTYQGQSSAPASLTISAQQPGILAPASFKVGATQYVAAVHSDTGAFVSNGNIPGVAAAPAKPGETLILYGTGFGTVSQTKVAGQIASGAASLSSPFTMTMGGAATTVSYAGLAPGLVGVYQFNVVVPPAVSSGDVPVVYTLNGLAATRQTLSISASAGTVSAPGAPTAVSATSGNASATISFTAPGANGGSAITRYTATCTAANSALTGTAAASPILVSGLSNGVSYLCTVSATNSAGTGPASAGVTVTPVASTTGGTVTSTLWIPPAISGTTFNLTLAKATKQYRTGAATNTYGYNGSDFWGPTLIMNKGDKVQMNVTNNLSESTTTHWHGFHIPPDTDGGPHQPFGPGETWSPSFEIKNNAGTYWYHPHLHEKTAEQLTYGAGGMIIIRDPAEAALALPRTYGVDDIPLVLTSRRFLTNNQFNINPANGAYGDFALTNGTLDAQTTLPKQFVRLRILNAEIERAYNLGFSDGRTFYVIGNDGGLLNAPVPVTRAKLYVGERLEILVDLSKDNTGAQVDLQAYNGGQTFGFPGGEPGTTGAFGSLLNNTTFRVLRINVGAATAGAITALPAKLIENTYWTSADVTNKRTVTITDKGPGTPFNFDNLAFDMDKINQTVALDAVEQWTIVNDRVFSHSFHIHDVQFKIVSRSSGKIEDYEQGWKDTVAVPLGESVTFIAKFDDFADVVNPFMYHCHFSNHEDEGMMGQFLVIKK